jgi:hypothetical protein
MINYIIQDQKTKETIKDFETLSKAKKALGLYQSVSLNKLRVVMEVGQ